MESGKLPLRDIHLPEAIGWWPPAIGWWILAILIPLFIALMFWLYKRITRKTAVKAAKKLLLEIKQDTHRENSQKLKDLSALIRRTAISINVRNECAGLTGQQWLEFLDRSVKGSLFTEGVGRLLADAPYRNNQPTEQEITQLTNLCENWLNAQTKKRKR
jgi:cbb3-type cytochrome oxidase subunit 3